MNPPDANLQPTQQTCHGASVTPGGPSGQGRDDPEFSQGRVKNWRCQRTVRAAGSVPEPAGKGHLPNPGTTKPDQTGPNRTKPDQTGPENENFHSGPRPETRNRKIRANRQDAECAKSESGKRKVETEMNCLVVKENYQLPSCNFQLPTAITTPHHAFFGLEGSRPQLAKVTRDYQRLPAMTEN